jgi:hypothetical protein
MTTTIQIGDTIQDFPLGTSGTPDDSVCSITSHLFFSSSFFSPDTFIQSLPTKIGGGGYLLKTTETCILDVHTYF